MLLNENNYIIMVYSFGILFLFIPILGSNFLFSTKWSISEGWESCQIFFINVIPLFVLRTLNRQTIEVALNSKSLYYLLWSSYCLSYTHLYYFDKLFFFEEIHIYFLLIKLFFNLYKFSRAFILLFDDRKIQ